MLSGLDCKGMDDFTHRTGGPKSVPVPARKTFNGTGTSRNVFLGAVPLRCEKRPMEPVPVGVNCVFFCCLWRVFCVLLCECFEFVVVVVVVVLLWCSFSFALVLCLLCRDVVVGVEEES